jgi:hypothetical protein
MTCTRTDPCSPSPCSPGVTCTADLPAGRYHCGPCPPGLRGDGRDCTAPDPCRPNPCFPGVACRAVTSGDDGDSNAVEEDFECGVCPPGMQGDGKTCTGWFSEFEVHCNKRFAIFRSPAEMLLIKLFLAGNYLIIPGQGEFGKCHPDWRRKNR